MRKGAEVKRAGASLLNDRGNGGRSEFLFQVRSSYRLQSFDTAEIGGIEDGNGEQDLFLSVAGELKEFALRQVTSEAES